MGQKNARQASQRIYMIQLHWIGKHGPGIRKLARIGIELYGLAVAQACSTMISTRNRLWNGKVRREEAAVLDIVLDHAHEFQRFIRFQGTSVNLSRSEVFLIPSTRVLKRVVEQLGMYGENFDRT